MLCDVDVDVDVVLFLVGAVDLTVAYEYSRAIGRSILVEQQFRIRHQR